MYPTARDLVGDFYPISQVRACRDSLEQRTDLRRYTASTLVDDLDEARDALGYDVINIYGTSYGSRAALTLAEDSGGRPFFPTDVREMPAIAAQIANDLRAQYVISYYPSNDMRDGSFRKSRIFSAQS